MAKMYTQRLLLQGVFNYGGKDYELVPAKEGASAEGCSKLVQLVLKQNEPCGAEQACHSCRSCFYMSEDMYRTPSKEDVLSRLYHTWLFNASQACFCCSLQSV